MSLPIRTTPKDIEAICSYLVTKPTGATFAEAKAILEKKILDARKLRALKFWGLIEDDGNKFKITSRGRQYVKNDCAYRSHVLREVIENVIPYQAVVERAVHNNLDSMVATEVAAYWYEHFKNDTSELDRTLNDQAICFFQIAQAADLGKLMIGRRGKPTRFDFELDTARSFVKNLDTDTQTNQSTIELIDAEVSQDLSKDNKKDGTEEIPYDSNKVFITHGKNSKILSQVKELVAYGKFEPIVAMEHETAAKPVPKKVMDDMRKCKAAVIHVSSDDVLLDKDGNEVPQINANVLIEIGAAMALYREKFVLLVEDGLNLPSNLQGLYECRYQGDELTMPAIMKLLKALNEF